MGRLPTRPGRADVAFLAPDEPVMEDVNSRHHVVARSTDKLAAEYGGHVVRVMHLRAHHHDRGVRTTMRQRRRKRLAALRNEGEVEIFREPTMKFNNHASATPLPFLKSLDEEALLEFQFKYTVQIVYEPADAIEHLDWSAEDEELARPLPRSQPPAHDASRASKNAASLPASSQPKQLEASQTHIPDVVLCTGFGRRWC